MKVIMWALSILVLIAAILVIVVHVSSALFDKRVKSEVEEIFAQVQLDKNNIVTQDDLAGLPLPVQKWLQNSQVIGKPKVLAVRLKQKGFFRTKEEQSWMPFTAEQYYTTDVPAFIWYTNMKPAPGVIVKGRDMYHNGRGNMLIKLMALIKVADATGPEMDQGTLIRYLNEIMWFPTAALNRYIQWHEINEQSAKAVMDYKGVRASAIYYFNEDGDLVDFVAERYMDKGGQFSKETWSTPISGYKEFDGIRVPTQGQGVWKLDSGDFAYIKLEVTDIEYNNPSLY